jgi:hypothetical protein
VCSKLDDGVGDDVLTWAGLDESPLHVHDHDLALARVARQGSVRALSPSRP